jgi:triphosphoribosyl-dephospho-CoA synthase
MNSSRIGILLKKQIKFVCDTEMTSLKPGNVHQYSQSYDMNIKDFFKSSLIISKCLTKNNLDLGKKILTSVNEIQDKIKKNTNLGIILMLSPIVTVVQKEGIISKEELIKKIKSLIKKQNIKNSIPIFKAISKTSPGGLGFSKKYDVNQLPKISLHKAMEYSKKKDLIARQYCNGFEDIYNIGIPAYKNFYNKWGNVNWAVTGVYLTFLKKFNDSHIVRNKGKKIATNVRKEAQNYYFFLKRNKNLSKIKKKLLFFDKKLKSKRINPGTTADLTVATLFFEKVTKKTIKKP